MAYHYSRDDSDPSSSYYPRPPPPIPPNPYINNDNTYHAPPPPPPGAYNPQQQQYGHYYEQAPRTTTTTTTTSNDDWRESSFISMYAPEPVTFVSSSGAKFIRNPSTSTSSTIKRPLNPPPIPREYYYQQQQGGGGPSRLSNDTSSSNSNSERYSIYSYPDSLDSTTTSTSNSRIDGLPHRKQSLEHLKAVRGNINSFDENLNSNFPQPIPEAIEPPRSRQPTILMSPPLDTHSSYTSPSPSSPYTPSASSWYETSSRPYPQAPPQAIDSHSSGGGGGGVGRTRRTSSYGSSSINSYSATSPGTFVSSTSLQTSPIPSPSLSNSHSHSTFDYRRPSQSTLSPHSSYDHNPSYPFSLSPSPSVTSDLLSLQNSYTSQEQEQEQAQLPSRYLNPAFLSHLAVYLKDHVKRGRKVKSNGVQHYGVFEAKDIVDTLLQVLPPPNGSDDKLEDSNSLLRIPPIPPPGAAPAVAVGVSPTSIESPKTFTSSSDDTTNSTRERRKFALSIARTLQQNLWFHEVDFDHHLLQDGTSSTGSSTEEEQVHHQLYTFSYAEQEETAREMDQVTRAGEEGGGGEEIPTGVITSLTRCESLVCTRENADGQIIRDELDGTVKGVSGGCYSFDCPNRTRVNRVGLHRVGSTVSINSGLVEPISEEAENWASSVPRSILESLDKREIAYQNQVFELIHGEQKYYNDLNLIETGFVEPLKLSNPPIIQPHRLPHFLQSILVNIADIRQHSLNFLSALRTKQSESLIIRGGIGKIVLTCAVEWGQSYLEYTKNFPMADWLFKQEKESNPRFQELLMDFHKLPLANKRGFDTFHNRATFRGLRYVLLLEQILKNAPNDNEADKQDLEYLGEAIKVIKQQGKEADVGVGEMKGKVMLRELEKNLVRKHHQGDLHDLELLDQERKFFLSGKVWKRPDQGTSGFTDQFQEANLILLDNYLITTKSPRPDRDGKQKYLINRRPVPIDLIQLKTSSFSEPPIPRSSGFHLRSNRSAGSPQPAASAPSPSSTTSSSFNSAPVTTSYSTSSYAAPSNPDSSLLYPISFFQMGRFDGLVYLYVDSPAQRLEWEKKLKEVINLRQLRQSNSPVIRLDPLADITFGTTSSIGSINSTTTTNGGGTTSNSFGKPTCSTPLKTIDGLWLIIAGCQEGIFIGWRGRPRSMQQVVHLNGITQCAVLPDFSFLLVVANKVLVAYALEALIPTKTANKLDQANKAPQRLSGQKDVSFFRVGKVGDADPRTLVIYAKKSGVKESVFKALEPVGQTDRSKGGGSGHRFLGFGKTDSWFRVHKEFFMPSLVTSLQFQRSKLALIGSRGVEIMDLESMRTMTVPDFPSVRHNRNFATLAKRCEEVPTLGMFRIADSKFLLVYADFAFHVGRHGEPIEGPFIEWESKPEQVAFCFPYIFAISPTIIEIRNAFSGRLAQFITGSHIYLTYDGSAISSSTSPASSSPLPMDLRPSRGSSLSSASMAQSSIEAETPVEKRLHVSMRNGGFHVLYEIVIVA